MSLLDSRPFERSPDLWGRNSPLYWRTRLRVTVQLVVPPIRPVIWSPTTVRWPVQPLGSTTSTSLPVTNPSVSPPGSPSLPLTRMWPAYFEPVCVTVISIWPLPPPATVVLTHVPCHVPLMSVV